MPVASHIRKVGDQLQIFYLDGRKEVALPTQGENWIISATDGGGGGGGDYSWPYPLANVTSEFGPRGSGFHEGMDWSGGPAVSGNPIPAIGDGEVTAAGFSGAFGNRVILFHGNWHNFDWYSLYAHMNTAPVVSVGANVSKGDTLGPIGNTGNSFGAHLHMEIHRVTPGGSLVWDNNNPSYSSNRTPINPRNFMNSYGDGGVIIT